MNVSPGPAFYQRPPAPPPKLSDEELEILESELTDEQLYAAANGEYWVPPDLEPFPDAYTFEEDEQEVILEQPRVLPSQFTEAAFRMPDKDGVFQPFSFQGRRHMRRIYDTPAKRILLQVSLEDAAQADQMFSVLMGEDVEQRRSFIQRNARDVRFLDI